MDEQTKSKVIDADPAGPARISAGQAIGARKSYQKPKLKNYGNLVSTTQFTGSFQNDSGATLGPRP